MSGALERLLAPIALAVVVHMLALLALLRTWSPAASEIIAPMEPVINATLVAMQAKAKPSRRKPIVVDEPVPKQLEKPTRVAEPKPVVKKAPASLPADADPVDTRAEQAREALAALEQAALDDAVDAEIDALSAADDESAVASYVGRIRAAVQGQWIRPPGARNGMQTVLQVELVPTGEVAAVGVVRSSGSEAFDRSAVAAVNKARRFDVPEDPALFERVFRRFRFLFNPEDLLR